MASAPQPSNYDIYATTFGKVRSGKVLDNEDFTYRQSGAFFAPFDEAGKLAAALAVDDVKENKDLRSKGDVEATIAKLLGK